MRDKKEKKNDQANFIIWCSVQKNSIIPVHYL